MAEPLPNPVLGELRQQYPEYNDMSDSELASALVRKDPQKWMPLVGRSIRLDQPMPPPIPTLGQKLPGMAVSALKTAGDIAIPTAGALAGGAVAGLPGALIMGGAGTSLTNMYHKPDEQHDPVLGGVMSGLGYLPSKAAGLTANLGRTLTSADRDVQAAARSFQQPIRLSPSEQTGHPGLAQTEGFAKRFPSSAMTMQNWRARQAGEVKSATGEIGSAFGPAYGPEAAGAKVKEEIGGLASRQAQATEDIVNRFTNSIGLPTADRGLFGQKMRDALWQANRDRRAASSAVYDAVETRLQGQTAPAAKLNTAATALVRTESQMRGLPNTLGPAGGLKATSGPEPNVQLSVDQMRTLARTPGADAGAAFEAGGKVALADLPTDFIRQYQLDTPRALDFPTMREIQSRLGSLIAVTKDDSTRRRLRVLFDAVSEDVQGLAGVIGSRDLAIANNFHRNEVGQLFGRRTFLRDVMNKTENDKIADALLATDSPAQVKAILRVLPLDAAAGYKATFVNRLHDAGLDPTTGQFSPERYLRAVDSYSGDTMRTILGDNYGAFTRMKATLQRDAAPQSQLPVFGRVLKADDQLALRAFIRDNAPQDVTRIMDSLTQEAQQAARSGQWTQIIQDSVNDRTGQFDFGRFLGQINKMDARTRTAFFGHESTDKINNLETVLQRVMTMSGSQNAAGGIGSHIGSLAQIFGSVRMAGGLLTGSTQIPQALANGLVLVSPSIVAKLMTSPTGIDLLTKGLTLKGGTIKSIEAAGQLAAQMLRVLGESDAAPTQRRSGRMEAGVAGRSPRFVPAGATE